jgi:2-octaprenyl-6-methoxyphenol hydroxylase
MPSATQAATDFDVVIAGGGLVGGSLALALSGLPVRVALVEPVAPESPEQPSFDDRSIALSHGSCRILQSLGIWDRLVSSASIWPIRQIHISEQGRFGTALIDCDEQGVPELGFVIKSRDLGNALWQHLRDATDVELLCPARVSATEMLGPKRMIDLTGANEPRRISSALLVVADGARSELRGQLGIAVEHSDYAQTAIVASVSVDSPSKTNVAFERFTPEGPLAILPGPAGRCTIVMARTSATAAAALESTDNEFLQLLQTAFGYRLGIFANLGPRNAYPLSLSAAAELTAERAVLVGNAAHGLHPVAAQGFNLGLRDVACLAELIADGLNRNKHAGISRDVYDSGTADLLNAYCEWRESDHDKVVRFTDSLIRGFGPAPDLIASTRGLALAGFDIAPGAKKILAHQTMGLGGRLSRLARGLPL